MAATRGTCRRALWAPQSFRTRLSRFSGTVLSITSAELRTRTHACSHRASEIDICAPSHGSDARAERSRESRTVMLPRARGGGGVEAVPQGETHKHMITDLRGRGGPAALSRSTSARSAFNISPESVQQSIPLFATMWATSVHFHMIFRPGWAMLRPAGSANPDFAPRLALRARIGRSGRAADPLGTLNSRFLARVARRSQHTRTRSSAGALTLRSAQA